jgi:redox-sensitive bicupin YhaK (pirin superfamily)
MPSTAHRVEEFVASRSVIKLVPSQQTSDGAGVKLNRSLGSQLLPDLDPFLLLDMFGSEQGADYIAGFPDHPHRGFETVTYMLDGRMRHQDNAGNGGTLGPGGVQWMTAGRGIVHSEMPEQEDGLMRGFQLWVNLPATDKMCPPRYQNLEADEIPEVVTKDGIRIKVIAGEVAGTPGAVTGIAVAPLYLDLALPAGGRYTVDIPAGHTAFAYPYEGTVTIGDGEPVNAAGGTLAILGDGDSVTVAAANGPARLILVAGKPLNEPIARYGPFVMNSREEIMQAFQDYQAGRF